jgi:hypothetical protein
MMNAPSNTDAVNASTALASQLLQSSVNTGVLTNG